MTDVHVAGVGMTRFGKFPERSLKDIGQEAVRAVLGDAGAAIGQVEAAYVGNATAGLVVGQEMIRGQVILHPLGFEGIPIFNVENACASGSSAFHLAWQAVASGRHDVVLALGAERLTHTDKRVSFEAIGSAIDVEDAAMAGAGNGQAGTDRSVFMDIYAGMAKRFMDRSGATASDFAKVVVKAHEHASRNELAQYRNLVSEEEVLDSREIVSPLTLLMCSPIGDGAAGAVICSERGLQRLGRSRSGSVTVEASVVRSGVSGPERKKSAALAAEEAYESSGIGPDDIDCIELHDATAPAELILYETLGLCKAEDAPRLLADGETALGGSKPVNTSGGLLCRGHPVGATGMAQLCELTWQLRGQAGNRQVEGARIALAENGGGWLEDDAAAATVHILKRR